MFREIALGSAVSISTYFLLISIACLLSCLWFVRRAEARDLPRVVALDLTITILIAGFIGARALHVLFEEPTYYTENPAAVLQVWNGGFVYLGGVVAAALATLIFCQIRREPFWFWADTAAPPISFGYALGRLACLLNGCCYGRECHLPWAIPLDGVYRHPTQAYASLWEFAVLSLLLFVEPRVKTSGVLFNVWLIASGIGRMIMENFRDDPRGDLLLGLSLGMWMSLGLAALGAFNLLRMENQGAAA